MRGRGLALLGFFLLVVLGCQQKPTKVTEVNVRPGLHRVLKTQARKPITIHKDTVLVDTRGDFEYSMAHVAGSIHLRWHDFTANSKPESGGRLYKPLHIARRLARYGISPEDHVVFLGQGLKGGGEEGRLAWMFYLLGIENIQWVTLSELDLPMTNEKTKPRENKDYWTPQVKKELAITAEEFRQEFFSSNTYKSATFMKKENQVFLDVRTEREYLDREGLGWEHRLPDFGAINISWKEFFNFDGSVRFEFARELEKVGITENKKVIVISDKGVRSAAVTMALLAMGYKDVTNLSEGLKGLFNL